MLLNPLTGELFTDEGILLKKIVCPLNPEWESLNSSTNSDGWRFCSNCSNYVIDSSSLSENDIIGLLSENPEACLLVDLNQDNIKIVNGFK